MTLVDSKSLFIKHSELLQLTMLVSECLKNEIKRTAVNEGLIVFLSFLSSRDMLFLTTGVVTGEFRSVSEWFPIVASLSESPWLSLCGLFGGFPCKGFSFVPGVVFLTEVTVSGFLGLPPSDVGGFFLLEFAMASFLMDGADIFLFPTLHSPSVLLFRHLSLSRTCWKNGITYKWKCYKKNRYSN